MTSKPEPTALARGSVLAEGNREPPRRPPATENAGEAVRTGTRSSPQGSHDLARRNQKQMRRDVGECREKRGEENGTECYGGHCQGGAAWDRVVREGLSEETHEK